MDLENKRRSYFNPRSYKRSDYYRPVPGDPVDEFQSTLLQEERRNHIRKDFPEVFISIHAPTRGATCFTKEEKEHIKISIHAPTRGATYVGNGRFEGKVISIHAPTRGATRVCAHKN